MRAYLSYLTVALLVVCTGCAVVSKPGMPPLPDQVDMGVPDRLQWSNSTRKLVGTPLLVGEKVYTTDTHYLEAYDRRTGKSLWRKKYKWVFSTGPVVALDQILVGTQNGLLVALDSKKGAVRWSQDLHAEILAAPLLHGDSVYVHTMDGAVFALDVKDGHLRWAAHHASPGLMLRYSSRPVAEQQRLWVGMADGHVLNLDAETGAVRWEQAVATPEGRTDVQRMVDIAATPVLDGGVLYVLSYQAQLSALSAQTGNVLWRYPASGYHPIRVDAKAIYMTDSNGDVLAVDREGQLRWRQDSLGMLTTGPVEAGAYILVGDKKGMVHWLSKADGSCLYSQKMARGAVQSIVVTPDQVIVGGTAGTLMAFSLKI